MRLRNFPRKSRGGRIAGSRSTLSGSPWCARRFGVRSGNIFRKAVLAVPAIAVMADKPISTMAPRRECRRLRRRSKVTIRYLRQSVGDVNVFYREAGPKTAPTILLLHGYPTSSHMFRDLISRLSDQFNLVAPDLPGFR